MHHDKAQTMMDEQEHEMRDHMQQLTYMWGTSRAKPLLIRRLRLDQGRSRQQEPVCNKDMLEIPPPPSVTEWLADYPTLLSPARLTPTYKVGLREPTSSSAGYRDDNDPG